MIKKSLRKDFSKKAKFIVHHQHKLIKKNNNNIEKNIEKNIVRKNILNIEPIKKPKNESKNIKIVPKSLNQEHYLRMLNDETKPIVVASGPAGSGKTLLATLWAIKAYEEKKYKKIIISRPNIAVDDKDIGFLPGDIFKKMTPWIIPIMDIFKEYYLKQEIEYLIKEQIFEICPMAYIRGRTFKNSVIIIDEAQGTTINSMLSILTRIGDNSKMIITGDIKQIDCKRDNNGLSNFINKIKSNSNLKYISLIEFNNKDIERHPAIREIIELYDNEIL